MSCKGIVATPFSSVACKGTIPSMISSESKLLALLFFHLTLGSSISLSFFFLCFFVCYLVLTNHADCFEAVLEAVYAMAESAAQTIKEFCPSIKGLVSLQSTRLEFRNLFVVM